jgi:multimeric flavodoxin WrbA
MTTVIIVYHSGIGHTTKLAEAVAKGAGAVPNMQGTVLRINGRAPGDSRK